MLDLVQTLTPKEKQVFDLLLTGASNQRIADYLYVSLTTVKYHLKNIYPKLGVSNRASALAYGLTGRESTLEVGAPQMTHLGTAYTEEQIRKAAMLVVEKSGLDKKAVNSLVVELLAALTGKM